ncbi:unnamed protein product [Boreogadus saida]
MSWSPGTSQAVGRGTAPGRGSGKEVENLSRNGPQQTAVWEGRDEKKDVATASMLVLRDAVLEAVDCGLLHASWMNPDASLHASPSGGARRGDPYRHPYKEREPPLGGGGGSGMRHVVFMLTYLSLVHL